ncbi:hypothetical protein AA0Y32_09900 [Georgenia phoenicis]|uniref:hypothetical protein n=1 Tax=unclassified Georgenia TaxID=2626815 RepID=UPI0039AFBEFD
MSVTHGADVEALRASSRELADTAQALLVTNVRVTGLIYNVEWNGPDAARFRSAWESEYSPRLSEVSAALNRAAADVLEQAADQERASSASGAMSSATDDLRARLRFQSDVLGLLPDAAKLGEVLRVSREAAASLARLDEVWELQELGRTTFAQGAGRLLGGLGVALSAADLYEGVQDGDHAKVFQSGVPLGVAGLGAAGFIGGGTAAAITVPFGVGTLIGTGVNEAMEGTTYGERVQENFDAVFRATGAAGPVVGTVLTPLVLLKGGLDMLVDDDGAPPIP